LFTVAPELIKRYRNYSYNRN